MNDRFVLKIHEGGSSKPVDHGPEKTGRTKGFRPGLWPLLAILCVAVVCAPSTQSFATNSHPVINEFVCNHVDTDQFEFVEIFGLPGMDYSTLTILEIEGDGPVAGLIDGIFPVGTTDADGFWTTGFMSNIIENGTLTLLLVENFSGSLGDDLDLDNDGVLDVTPFTAIVDDVAVTKGAALDRTYSSVTLFTYYDGFEYAPGGASRIPNGTDTGTIGDWMRNDFDGDGLPDFLGTPIIGEALNTPGAVNEEVVPPGDPVINEFVANHVGYDDHEFVEVFGDVNTNYANFTVIEIEGDGTNAGKIDAWWNLGISDGDGFWTTGFLDSKIENGSMTLMLVELFTGYVGQDLDTDNDGVLDVTPFNRVVDDVAILNGGVSDWVYSSVALTEGFDDDSYLPGGASRIPNGTDTDAVDDWYRNDYDGYGLPEFTGTPDAHEAINTPGAVNETVADITPPVITVDLNRTVLWPPNHKMIEICATVEVTDDRDPAPVFVLTSVMSSEPDNGKGDGNTTNDIQGADTGTDDVCFELRAERQGGGCGREYTIVYTATDAAGNTSSMTVAVRVPHDHSGWAMASSGFLPDGTAIDENLERFALVIPSRLAGATRDENGNLVATSEGYDATRIDIHHAYVGNAAGSIRPKESMTTDANGDGLDDLVLYYSTAGVLGLLAENKPAPGDDKKIEQRGSNGPIGLHYEGPDGTEYLVTNVFELGTPVRIVAIIPLASSEHSRTGSLSSTGVSAPVAYPNPFNPSTTISYEVPVAGMVNLRIYDAAGRLIDTVDTGAKQPGQHTAVWDGCDTTGVPAASGVYFVRLEAAGHVRTSKIVLLK